MPAGRPKGPGRKVQVSTYIDPDLLEEVERLAVGDDRSVSYVIAKAIEQQVRKGDGDKETESEQP